MTYKGTKSGGNAMVPHMSGTTLDAQARYAAGVKKILENYFTGKPQTPTDVIVENGQYATKYAILLSQMAILICFQGLWSTQVRWFRVGNFELVLLIVVNDVFFPFLVL